MSRKILSLILSFTLLFSQTGFAQVAGQLNIAAYLGTLHQPPIDKLRLPHLRYFSYDNLNNNFRIILDKGDLKEIKGLELQDSAGELLKYFLIGITLPNEAFWVNLRPDSADNIIDDWLAQTDVGKILLEADLQLKKDTARFTSPQTPEGKLYWDKLYKKAEELFGSENISIPTLTRPWIVPGEVIIRETDTSAYVYKATLKVMLEEDHLRDSPLRGQSLYSFTDPRLKALNEYSSQLIRQLIIPKLTKEVNISKRYAELRQVYYSLILSRWFKARFYGKGGIYSWAIDKKNLNGLTSQGQWSKTTYFKEYQKSFKEGEYNQQVPVLGRSGQNIRSYFSGGFTMEGAEFTKTAGAGNSVVGGLGGKILNFPQILGNEKNVFASGQAPSNLTTLLPKEVQVGVAGSPVAKTRDEGGWTRDAEGVSSPVRIEFKATYDDDFFGTGLAIDAQARSRQIEKILYNDLFDFYWRLRGEKRYSGEIVVGSGWVRRIMGNIHKWDFLQNLEYIDVFKELISSLYKAMTEPSAQTLRSFFKEVKRWNTINFGFPDHGINFLDKNGKPIEGNNVEAEFLEQARRGEVHFGLPPGSASSPVEAWEIEVDTSNLPSPSPYRQWASQIQALVKNAIERVLMGQEKRQGATGGGYLGEVVGLRIVFSYSLTWEGDQPSLNFTLIDGLNHKIATLPITITKKSASSPESSSPASEEELFSIVPGNDRLGGNRTISFTEEAQTGKKLIQIVAHESDGTETPLITINPRSQEAKAISGFLREWPKTIVDPSAGDHTFHYYLPDIEEAERNDKNVDIKIGYGRVYAGEPLLDFSLRINASMQRMCERVIVRAIPNPVWLDAEGAASPADMTNTQFQRLEAIRIIHDIHLGQVVRKQLQDNFHRIELTDIYADLIQEMIESPSTVLQWLEKSKQQLDYFRTYGFRDADWFVQRAGFEAIGVLAGGGEAFIPRIGKPTEAWNKAISRFIGLIRISLQYASGDNQYVALSAIGNALRSKWLSWEQLPEDLRAGIKQQLIQTVRNSEIDLRLRLSLINALGHLRTEQEVKDCLHTLSVSGTPETIRKRAKTILDRWRSDSAASPVVIDAKNMKEGEDRDIVKRGKVHVYFYYDNKYHVERTLCITGKKDGREIYFTFHFEKPLFSKTSAKDAFFYQARPPYAHSHNIEATINDWHSFIKTLAVQSNEKDRTIEIRVRNEDISALRQLETDNPGLSLENIHLEGDERFNTIKFVTEFSAAASPVEQVQGQGQSPSTPEIGRTGTVPKGISASPAKENFGDSPLRGQSPLNPGGIDFRSIPLIVQPIGNFSNLKFDNLPNTLTLQKLNLDEEFREISSMIAKGILPSGQRVKEYILACFYKKELSQRIDDLILCLTDICRLEEELAQESEPELKESLMLVEAAGVS